MRIFTMLDINCHSVRDLGEYSDVYNSLQKYGLLAKQKFMDVVYLSNSLNG